MQIKIAPKADQRDHDDDSTTRETEEPKLDSSDIKPYATPEEIKNGKLALEELVSLPVFKVPVFDFVTSKKKSYQVDTYAFNNSILHFILTERILSFPYCFALNSISAK